MPNITIPASLDEATERLAGLDRLLVAKEWERAALVYAFTREDRGGRPAGNRAETRAVSCREFARRGIAGLSNPGSAAPARWPLVTWPDTRNWPT